MLYKIWRDEVICVLAARHNELGVGDDKDASLEAAKGAICAHGRVGVVVPMQVSSLAHRCPTSWGFLGLHMPRMFAILHFMVIFTFNLLK